MYFDTHCHLNFKRYINSLDDVINRARIVGVKHIIVPGTDIDTSKKGVEIAERNEYIFASVGIHPHHVTNIKYQISKIKNNDINQIKVLLQNPKVVAVGEVGLDYHTYEKSKYGIHEITDEDINIQKEFLIKQIKMALEYDKSLILHNREAVNDLLETLNEEWDEKMKGRVVFHCCESDDRLLNFAKENSVYIGVDGDVTYMEEKALFVKKVPLELMVVETDSPYLLPEPLRSQKKFPNEPVNIPIIVKKIAEIKGLTVDEVSKRTYENGRKLFKI